MGLHRFFCADITPNEVLLDEEEFHHLRVLRLDKDGQEVEVFDGNGSHRIVRVVRGKRGIRFVAETPVVRDKPFSPQITLAVSPPKGERLDTLIQMGQELALNRLVPMFCERSPERATKAKLRLGRLRKVALSAAKQSEVNFLTEICEPMEFEAIIQRAKEYSLSLIFTPHSAERITNLLRQKRDISSVLYLIGPEGDFTEDELEEAKSYGCVAVTMPLPVLRIETASVAALTLLRCLSE
ncbi:MAG: 16S rRNA (uracil(1498)-N(3))-methyltransferase [Planctomycetota bacterium]|nr:16S rRNA (uracil(1498)-N(3))-methyltransferase [Planctomycetota bacterium]